MWLKKKQISILSNTWWQGCENSLWLTAWYPSPCDPAVVCTYLKILRQTNHLPSEYYLSNNTAHSQYHDHPMKPVINLGRSVVLNQKLVLNFERTKTFFWYHLAKSLIQNLPSVWTLVGSSSLFKKNIYNNRAANSKKNRPRFPVAKYHQWIDPKDPPTNQTTNRAFQQTLNRSFVLCGQNLSRATRNFPPANQKKPQTRSNFLTTTSYRSECFFIVFSGSLQNWYQSWPILTPYHYYKTSILKKLFLFGNPRGRLILLLRGAKGILGDASSTWTQFILGRNPDIDHHLQSVQVRSF